MSKSYASVFLEHQHDLTEFGDIVLPQELEERFYTAEIIGQSDLGETYILSEKNTKELYVLKSQEIISAAAGNEAGLLKELSHNGIPTYEMVIERGDTRYILRKYIDGTPLDEFTRDMSSIDPAQVVDYVLSLCDILIYLHSQPEPIIHRDIKPSNIIIDHDNSIRLIDFGISRKYQKNSAKDTAYFGTHKYAPPEQYGFAQTDCRTDIYSLGVVMRYWLTGKTDRGTVIRDKRLGRIVSKCTAFAPEARYQSTSALKRALFAYKNRVRRRIVTAATCITIAAALCIGLYAGFFSTNTPDDTPVTYQTPVGYNDAEYQKLVALFLHEDNLAKIKTQHSDFNIEIPSTWFWEREGTWTDDDGTEHPFLSFVAWQQGRVAYLHLPDLGLTGEFDASGFEHIRVLNVLQNNLTDIKLSGCISLRELFVDRDILATLDLSGLPALEFVN